MKASSLAEALLLVIREKGDREVYLTWEYYPAPLPKRRCLTIMGVGFDDAHEGAGGSSDAAIKIMIQP
jgi:hypothetical protein